MLPSCAVFKGILPSLLKISRSGYSRYTNMVLKSDLGFKVHQFTNQIKIIGPLSALKPYYTENFQLEVRLCVQKIVAIRGEKKYTNRPSLSTTYQVEPHMLFSFTTQIIIIKYIIGLFTYMSFPINPEFYVIWDLLRNKPGRQHSVQIQVFTTQITFTQKTKDLIHTE